MKRISLLPRQGGAYASYRYLDSVHASIVAGLTTTGIPASRLIGQSAAPWTFAARGYAQPGGQMTLTGLLISTPDAEISEALERLNPQAMVKHSTNGDTIDLGAWRKVEERRRPHPEAREVCIGFASPFAISVRKQDRGDGKPRFFGNLTDVNVAEALRQSVVKRLPEGADLEVAIDRLTLAVEGTPRPVSLKSLGGKRQMVFGYRMPVTLRGDPKAIAATYFGGLGAKTRLGFGCPILNA